MFTKETDKKIKLGILAAVVAGGLIHATGYFGFRNDVADKGYRPEQPVPFSHKQHAGDLEISCQYCHTTVEKSAHSPVPSTSTCMNCHSAVKTESPKLQKVRDSWEKNQPIEWRRIHKLPDYVQFPHMRHIRAQIDCSSCHGKIEEMGVVAQAKSLSMGWCLDCHRNPEDRIIPARPISGIFTAQPTTAKTDLYKPVYDKIPMAAMKALTNPEYGQWMTPVSEPVMHGVPMPKKAGRGPENCSACHY
ncbi:MAG: cytochrome c3 family protein [Bacteroidota bacterium]